MIEAIRLAMEGGYQLEPVEYFVEGNQVEVIAGPMKGVKGLSLIHISEPTRPY